MALFVMPFLLSGALTAQEKPKQQRPLVLAYYYPWYEKGDWSRHEYVGTPKLGKYGTDDPAIARQHIRWARDGGIDALIVSWWGPDHMAARHTRSGLLKASNFDAIRFSMIYESLGRLDHLDGKTDTVIDFSHADVANQFSRDMSYLKKTYFEHPSYLKANGRPVLVLYVTRTFRNFEPRHILDAESHAGVDLFLIADECFFGEQRNPATARHGIRDGRPVFDAYTAYNMFENRLVRQGETAIAYMSREAQPIFQRWAEKTVLYPHVMPSYHDFRGNKPLPGDVAGFRKQLQNAAELKNPANAGDVPRMIFITSFNEWWEGTTIEPAEEYGTSYLDALRRFNSN